MKKYIAPVLRAIDTTAEDIICTSPTGTNVTGLDVDDTPTSNAGHGKVRTDDFDDTADNGWSDGLW